MFNNLPETMWLVSSRTRNQIRSPDSSQDTRNQQLRRDLVLAQGTGDSPEVDEISFSPRL